MTPAGLFIYPGDTLIYRPPRAAPFVHIPSGHVNIQWAGKLTLVDAVSGASPDKSFYPRQSLLRESRRYPLPTTSFFHQNCIGWTFSNFISTKFPRFICQRPEIPPYRHRSLWRASEDAAPHPGTLMAGANWTGSRCPL